jgi:hypothetical protein
MIYVYAVIDPVLLPWSEVRGLEGKPTEPIDVENLYVLSTRHPARINADQENLRCHERVVEAFMTRSAGALLPARFGTTFAGEAELRQTIWRQREPLRRGLDHVRGCVELGVRILLAPSPPQSPSPTVPGRPVGMTGRQYMQSLQITERHRQAIEHEQSARVSAMNEILSPLARDVVLPTQSASMPNLVYLVERDRMPRFIDTLSQLTSDRPEMRALCTGPWPPYHFSPTLEVGQVT